MDYGFGSAGTSAAGTAAGGFGASTGDSETGATGLVVGKVVSVPSVLFSILVSDGATSDGAVSDGAVSEGIGSLEPIPPIPPAPDFLRLRDAGSLAISRLFGRYQKVVKAQRTIQSRTETAVILVKISPAFTPKALAPPAPPKAPVKPPPRPRWSKMINTIKSERRNRAGPKMYWESIAKGKNTAKISSPASKKPKVTPMPQKRQTGM